MTRRCRRRRIACALAVPFLIALAAVPAAAQPLDPGFELRADLFRASFDSSVRFDSAELGLGTDLDLESDLAVEDESDVVRGELLFRTGNRSRLTLDYAAFDREGEGVVGRTFRFGDFTFRADADVVTQTETSFAALGWRYALYKDPRSEIGLSLSVAWVDISASVAGLVVIQGGPSIEVEESGEASGPVPMLGLHGAWWLGDRMRISAAGRYLEIDDLDGWGGSALDLGARFDWFFLDNLGVGGGYSATTLEAESNDPEEDGLSKAESSFDGFRVGLTVVF
jgi:hypothetical protein